VHRPDTTPFRSSYFSYEVYPFQRPADMDAPEAAIHPVVVIGAGPSGLVLAIQLRKHGIPCVLIEAEAQVSGGSRAVALTKRSMEIIEQSGAAERFLAKAITWREGHSYYKNSVVHHLDIPYQPDDKFEPMTNLGQCLMEDILVEEALAQGVDIRFQTALVGLTSHENRLELELDTPEGVYRCNASWVVGCDGARSAVRRLTGLRFEGESFESRFVIADFKMELDEPAGRRCYFEPPWLPGQTALVHKTHPWIWRLDYQVPDGMSDEEAIRPERIKANIEAHLAYVGIDRPWQIEWISLYRPNAMTLAEYHHGRVLLCGDAAHLLPVFGVRGMNTGVQDAINLGWKLAAVIQGQAKPSLLATYSTERVADARQICVEAARSTRMVAPPSHGFRVMQRAVLSLALNRPWVRGLLHWRTSHPIDYANSPLTRVDATEPEFKGGPPPGAPPRNARLDPDRPDAGFLLDHFQAAFQVLVFGDDPELWRQALEDVLALREEGIAVRLLALPRRPDQAPAGADRILLDSSGHVAALWGCAGEAVYVLRPDQHVASRWTAGSAARVSDVIRQSLGIGAA